MVEKTVIIANRRYRSDYWEGYTERSEAEAQNWLDYYRSLGQIAKVFQSMSEYHADCNMLLDKWEAKQRAAQVGPMAKSS